jgi:hypothetical protein
MAEQLGEPVEYACLYRKIRQERGQAVSTQAFPYVINFGALHFKLEIELKPTDFRPRARRGFGRDRFG